MIQRNALSLSHPLKMFSHTELMAKTTLTLFTLMTLSILPGIVRKPKVF